MATDFSSLDKLMEFGLGLGIATQMMNTMNHVISQTAIPGVGINPGINYPSMEQNSAEASFLKKYYIVHDEKVAGPLDEKEIERLLKNGVIGKQTFCWSPGMSGWKFAENIPEINKLILLNS